MNIAYRRSGPLAAPLLLVSALAIVSSCGGSAPPVLRGDTASAAVGSPRRIGDRLLCGYEGYSIELDLTDLSCVLRDAERRTDTVISKAAFPASRYRFDDELSVVRYPERRMQVRVACDGGSFSLEFASEKPQRITWPSLTLEKSGTALIWPHFEGYYVPLDDAVWAEYLASRPWDTTADQYLPFWGIERGKRLLSYLVENPFHNDTVFRNKRGSMLMDFSHTFPDNADLSAPIAISLYFDYDVSPIAPARHFRKYLEDRGAVVTLDQKIKKAPVLARMIGAPHAYVWGGAPITIADVRPEGWIPLAAAIVEQSSAGLSTAGGRIMHAASSDGEGIEAMSGPSAPSSYLRRSMASALSAALSSRDLYSEAVWPLAALPSQCRAAAEKLLRGSRVAPDELVRLNSHLLYASFPEYLYEPSGWGDGVSTRMIDALKDSGMDRFVLVCNGIEELEIRPEVASYATERGYLLGPYDGYFDVQDPDDPHWPTAVFDKRLYETGGVINADGTPLKGFLGVGYYVNPLAVKPYCDRRVAENFRKAPSSYYFLDCEAYGEFFDDYRPGRETAASQTAAARVDLVASVFERYRVPVGSEGGSYLFAGSLAIADGVFFPVLAGDEDMRLNEMSYYFLGRPFPADEPETHFASVPLKERYVHLFGDPRFRLPLYEAVLHDSVVDTAHYASASLKFTTIAETTALTELLYQVPPMYHFNLRYFEAVKASIKPHVEAFGTTHAYSYRYPLEDFRFLTDDRLVQRTAFGALALTANFRDEDFIADGLVVPARSLLVERADSGASFVYRPTAPVAERPRVPTEADIPSLVAGLKDDEWQVRMEAARALANLKAAAAPAVPALMKVLKDDAEWQIRKAAAYALGAIGGKAKAAIPLLIEALRDEEWQIRRPAAVALGAMGRAARRAIPALRAGLGDPELQVRLAIEEALRNLDGR